MMKARLNFAYGLRPRIRRRQSKMLASSRQLFGEIRKYFCSHFHCQAADVRFAQNVTTHVAQIVSGIKKLHPKMQVFVDSHEVPWIKGSLENGRLQMENMTRPNYAALQQRHFRPTEVSVFNPNELLRNLSRFVSTDKPAVIVLSHVSRLSGQIFPIQEIYSKMKAISPNSVLVVDGAQAAGAMKVDARNSGDAYITVTSKFLDAQPNIAMAYLSPELRSKYLADYPQIGANKFLAEAHSAVQSISHPAFREDFTQRIRNTRQFALEKLKGVKGISIKEFRNQAPQIITVKVGGRARTMQLVEELAKHGVEVFHNMGFSISEPREPLLRISIGAKTSRTEIEKFVKELRAVLRHRTRN